MRTNISALALSLLAAALLAQPAHATGEVVFTESFESCTDPAGPPSYTEYTTATAAAQPILVNLWIDENINCPGWTADGQAWMTTYSSGGIFPDGTHAAWLNEGDDYISSGSIERDVTGLTPGHDYQLSLETWTDDQDEPTSLTMEVTNGTDVSTQTLNLAAGEGIQALEKDFSAVGDTVTLKLIGSDSTFASPIVDNIRITDIGVTEAQNSSSGATSKLAETGFDALTVGGIAAFLLTGGAALMFARRRASRR